LNAVHFGSQDYGGLHNRPITSDKIYYVNSETGAAIRCSRDGDQPLRFPS